MNIICNTFEEFKNAIKLHQEYVHWVYENNRPFLTRCNDYSVSKDEYTEDDLNHYVIYEYNCISEIELNKLKDYVTAEHFNNSCLNIINEVLKNLGKEFKSGILIGLQLTEEDYCYAYKNKDGKIIYNTCFEKIDN